MPSQSATQILDIAERRMRLAGYNAVSFRDIAAEMGIKSASLHYHFPKKADLGTALVKRYADNFHAVLSEKTHSLTEPKDRISAFIDIFRDALQDQNLNCLCAVLGAEAPGLPGAVSQEVRNFFEANIAWLMLRVVIGVYARMAVGVAENKAGDCYGAQDYFLKVRWFPEY